MARESLRLDANGRNVLGVWERETEEVHMIRCDPTTLAIKILNYVWDPETLEAKMMTQPAINIDSDDLTLTMGDMEKLGAGTYWRDFRYKYDANGNCTYQGKHTELNASEDSINWYITRYDYTDENCMRKRVRMTSWTNAELGW